MAQGIFGWLVDQRAGSHEEYQGTGEQGTLGTHKEPVSQCR